MTNAVQQLELSRFTQVVASHLPRSRQKERSVSHQLYMWRGTRTIILERHRFYADQTRKRVLVPFANIEEEAQQYAADEYDRLGSMPSGDDEGPGMDAIAEYAHEKGLSLYLLLNDLRKQTTLGALAGMYHQFEKDLRDFIERELVHTLPSAEASKLAWNSASIGKIYDILEKFSWPVRKQRWFPFLDSCRLVVNVHKHGKGASLKTLAAQYPEYLRNPFDDGIDVLTSDPDHEDLDITDAQFAAIEKAIEHFWQDFPERLYYPPEDVVAD